MLATLVMAAIRSIRVGDLAPPTIVRNARLPSCLKTEPDYCSGPGFTHAISAQNFAKLIVHDVLCRGKRFFAVAGADARLKTLGPLRSAEARTDVPSSGYLRKTLLLLV
jgi:hypothetical protein